jgi:hypothetical protein
MMLPIDLGGFSKHINSKDTGLSSRGVAGQPGVQTPASEPRKRRRRPSCRLSWHCGAKFFAPRDASTPPLWKRGRTDWLQMYSNFPGGWETLGGYESYSNQTNVTSKPQIVTRPAPATRQSSMRVGAGEQAADAGHAMFSPKSGQPFNPNTQSRNINGYVRQSSSLPKHTCSRSQCGVFSLSQPAARRGLAILLPLPLAPYSQIFFEKHLDTRLHPSPIQAV